MNVLDVDPKNLAFDFKRDWHIFQDGRVKTFLIVWLRKAINEQHRVMEQCNPVDLGRSQGVIVVIKQMLNLVQQPHCEESLKAVLEFLNSNDK